MQYKFFKHCDKIEAWMAYCQANNHCATVTRKAKRDFFLSKSKNPTLLWRRIKECTGLGKTRFASSFWPCNTPTLSKASANKINKNFLDKVNALNQVDTAVSPTEVSSPIGKKKLDGFTFIQSHH